MRDPAARRRPGRPGVAGQRCGCSRSVEGSRSRLDACAATSEPSTTSQPPATPDEVHAAAVQYVRKISGSTHPSQTNQAAFDRAVQEVAAGYPSAPRRAEHDGATEGPGGGGGEGQGSFGGAVRVTTSMSPKDRLRQAFRAIRRGDFLPRGAARLRRAGPGDPDRLPADQQPADHGRQHAYPARGRARATGARRRLRLRVDHRAPRDPGRPLRRGVGRGAGCPSSSPGARRTSPPTRCGG